MQSLRFREILLASHKEKRARKIRFHPLATVIHGKNDTGKSSIIKSILRTFGTVPAHMHPRWKTAEVYSLVKFSINGFDYSIYRQGDSYSLFSGSGVLIATYSSVTNELGPKLASLCDFKLVLADRNGEPKIPPPAFLFLPFYIDQDAGWAKNWSSFSQLPQFPNWRQDVVKYHTGIRPNRWYELKANARIHEKAKEEPLRREQMLRETITRFRGQLLRLRFDIDVASYKVEIDRLLNSCEALLKKEEEYKNRLIELDTERIRLEAQRDIVSHARLELNADYEFATQLEEDGVECPTCGANYTNSFADRFAIACDEDRCIALLQRIREDLKELEDKIRNHRESLSETTAELHEVNALLAARQGEVTLKDLLQNEGKREAARVLRTNLDEVREEIAQIETTLREVNEELSKLDDRKRTAKIAKEYKEHMRRHLALLNVTTLEEKSYRRIDASIKESGSDLPRAILAYVFSILHVIKAFGSCSFCPLVIDAPDQQEQDEPNLKKMLEFIRDRRPDNTQLVLGLVDDCGIDFGGDVIEMTEKNFALIQDDYANVVRELEPYSAANLGL